MLRLASKTTPRETGASSELKYLSCCSTPSSNNRNASFGRPENDAPNGSVTVTGISVNLTFTRIAGCGEVLGRGALRAVWRTSTPRLKVRICALALLFGGGLRTVSPWRLSLSSFRALYQWSRRWNGRALE